MIKELEDFLTQIDAVFKDNPKYDLDIVRELPSVSNENNEIKFTEFSDINLGIMYFLIVGTNNLPTEFINRLKDHFNIKVEAGIETFDKGSEES